jgi:hypothetical protein
MRREELLEEFKARISRYERHQLLLERAKEYSESFNDIVVERVVSDHNEQSLAVVSEVVLLYADMEETVTGLSDERQSVAASQENPRFNLQELELRLMIGEIGDDDYQSEATQIRDFLSETDERLAELDGEVVSFQQPMEHWVSLCGVSE